MHGRLTKSWDGMWGMCAMCGVCRALASRLSAEDDDWATIRENSGVKRRTAGGLEGGQGQGLDDDGSSLPAAEEADEQGAGAQGVEEEEAVDLGDPDAPLGDDDDSD